MSILSVKNLEKKFGDLTVLKDISFDINDGEIISIIGSSGSGKSTLLRCMNQLETITSGTITIDGKTLVETKNGAPVYAGKDILKEILMESIYFQLSDEEIAKAHGLTKENVRQIRCRTKKKLISSMKEGM